MTLPALISPFSSRIPGMVPCLRRTMTCRGRVAGRAVRARPCCWPVSFRLAPCPRSRVCGPGPPGGREPCLSSVEAAQGDGRRHALRRRRSASTAFLHAISGVGGVEICLGFSLFCIQGTSSLRTTSSCTYALASAVTPGVSCGVSCMHLWLGRIVCPALCISLCSHLPASALHYRHKH